VRVEYALDDVGASIVKQSEDEHQLPSERNIDFES